jgi:hypothetical protein
VNKLLWPLKGENTSTKKKKQHIPLKYQYPPARLHGVKTQIPQYEQSLPWKPKNINVNTQTNPVK